jgi:hypothetical protein
MDLIFTCFCCGCFILNMMFARFKFVVKRYCVHTCYKSYQKYWIYLYILNAAVFVIDKSLEHLDTVPGVQALFVLGLRHASSLNTTISVGNYYLHYLNIFMEKNVNLCTIYAPDQTFTLAWPKLAKFTLVLEMHINLCKFVRVGKKTGRFVYHVVYVITVISWLFFCLCDYCG